MESDESKNNQNQSKRQAQKKRARRTRKDEDGRDFVCSCGKSYLSYPALYTHIKTKHDGKAPQRAGDDQDRAVMKEDLEQLKMLLSKYYPERLRATPLNELSEIFSTEERQYIMPLLVYWENEEKTGNMASEKKLLSAREVLGKFVYDMNKRINPSCIKFLVKLVMLIHTGVCAQKKDDKYCDECTMSVVPSLFNDLILNGHIPIDKEAPQKIMQDSEAVCKVLVYMCNWMFNQKYTNYSVKYRL